VSDFKLNENQQKAVNYKEGDLLIIAGAGTGKTAVLTQRIISLIKDDFAKPSEIVALTFTEKAAQEMQERVDIEMEYGYEEPLISTFHSFCDKILREDGYNIGLDGGYTLMSSAQSYIFLRRHLYDLPLKTLKPRGNPTKFLNDLLSHFSRLQDEDVSPQEYLEYASTLPQKSKEEKEEKERVIELANTYKKYSELKLENSKLDFGDLIILTIKLFRERENILSKYRDRFKYILVDEFQDTNYTQNVLVNILVLGNGKKRGNGPQLTVVGDDDQAIYKFRGAAISNILQFKETYPKAEEIVLIENYRSRQEILDSAYTLIKNNDPHRLEVTEGIDKRLIARRRFKKDSQSVKLIVGNNDLNEAEKVADQILELTGYTDYVIEDSEGQVFDEKGQSSFVSEKKGDYKFSDIAIFVRANAHADMFIQALRNRGIPYKIGGSRGLYFRPEIKNLVAFLRVLVDYSDEISMYRLLSMPIWNLNAREYVDVVKEARFKKITLLEQLEELWNVKLGDEGNSESSFKEVGNSDLKNIFSPKAIAGIGSFLLLMDSSIKKVKDGRAVSDILYDFITQSSYIDSFLEKEETEGVFAVSNIHKFLELLKQYEKDNPESNVYEYVDYLNYSIEIGESPLVDQTDLDNLNAINIMTVHGSKGLEFPVVFLVNLVAQRFPSVGRSDSIPIPDELIKETLPKELGEKESHIQEERRLFYVGATRAMEKLFLSAAYYYGDAKRKKKPSLFLNEILDRRVDEEFRDVKEDALLNKGFDVGVLGDEDLDPLLSDASKEYLLKRFSYSQLNIYETCPRKYEYAYVLKVPQKPSAALSFGITIHNTLRDFYTLVKRSQTGLVGITDIPEKEDLIDMYLKNWVGVGYESSKHEELRKKEGMNILKNYYEKTFDEKESPLRIEEGFTVYLGDVVFVGKIDRIDLEKKRKDVTEVSIIDFKTGREKDEKGIKDDMQLPLYALFAEEKLGYRVVKAKYVYVESGTELEVDVSKERKELAKEKLLKAIEEIKKGNFKATPGYVCRFCDYASICEYAEV
jgi:DNA helicase-2/ATP-dependent DNA helicase PcrA